MNEIKETDTFVEIYSTKRGSRFNPPYVALS